MLAINDVTKSFSGFRAVNHMSLSVGPGDVHALIGPNGAGKSTLLNVVAGQFPPDSGSVRYKEESITGLPPHRICRKGIARSFQVTSVFGGFTVFQNVQLALMARRGRCWNLLMPASGVLVEEVCGLLDQVRMSDQASRLASELAAGDRKRLEFGMALAGDPELLLLDEPTAGMSSGERARVVSVIKEINESRGVAILFTEHDIDMVFAVARKVTVMHQGEKIAEGTPEEIRRHRRVREVYLGENGDADL